MGALWVDIRFAARLMSRNPGFTLVAVLTLALGVGANTAIFSVVNRTLLVPLPYGNPDRLVQVWETLPAQHIDENTPAPSTLALWRARATSVEDFAAYTTATANLTGQGDPERLQALRVSANLLGVLGVRPALGRSLTADEERFGGPAVALLSDQLWARRFNRDPRVIDKTIVLNGRAATVIGVLPADVPLTIHDADLWMPLALAPSENPESRMLFVIARLKNGVTPPHAQRELDAAMHEPGVGSLPDGIGVNVQSLDRELRGAVRPDLVMVFAMSGVVLVIACTNVAGMLLARGLSRRREFSIRSALGAGRGRLVRLVLVESILLGVGGSVLGVAASAWSLQVIRAIMPAALAQTVSGAMDGRAFAFAAGLALVTAVLTGLAPAFAGTGGTLVVSGRSGDSNESAGVRALRSGLVMGQMALAVVLLSGAALLVKSFIALVLTPTGFSAASVMTAQVYRADPDDARRTQFYQQLIDAISAVPGVRAAGLINGVPLRFTGGGSGFLIDDGRTPEHFVSGQHRIVSAGYLRAMAIPLVRGESFRGDERPGDAVAIVSQSFADRAWPGADPIGHRMRWGSDGQWLRVIGVAADIRLTRTLPVLPHVYLPFTQVQYAVYEPSDIVIKMNGDATTAVPALRDAVRRLDPDQSVASVLSLQELLDRSVGRRRFTLTLMMTFAAVALVLASVGIYGVLTYLVRRRTREIGVRMAIGASAARIRWDVLRRGLGLTAVGASIGVGAMIGLVRLNAAWMPEITRVDPLAIAGAVGILSIAAIVACDLPARRAMKVDPMRVLGSD